MSLRLMGSIKRFSLKDYAEGLGIEISERSISQLKLLWIVLADFQNEKTGQCNPSMETLAKCIEKSVSQTIGYMKLLKKLGLVTVARNAKGGRWTPQYELSMPNPSADKSASPPINTTPQISADTTPPTERFEGSYAQESAPPVDRTRTLIDTLDESLIKSLMHEKDISKRNAGLVGYATKYGFEVKNNTPIHEVETWLLNAIKRSNSHGIIHAIH